MNSVFTLKLLSVHFLLHITSFIFNISNKRNLTYNIIWPEMKWHSLLFAYRSLITMTFIWFQQNQFIDKNTLFISRIAVVYLTMASADYVSWIFKDDKKLTTMRDNPYPKNTPKMLIKYINLFYSISQVYATLNILFLDFDTIFLTLIPIQTAPFTMTLQKKGIINQFMWHFLYIAALGSNFLYAFKSRDIFSGRSKYALIFSICRFKFNLNKYFLWTIILIINLLGF
jgi:hypothetical protein